MAKEITTANFEAEVLKSEKPILIDFWATWCGPCMRQGPVVEEETIDLISMLVKTGLVPTRSEGRRAIEQGGVSIDGEKITDVKYVVAKDALAGDGIVLKKGKKKFNKIVAK